jgi:hypothetical protein
LTDNPWAVAGLILTIFGTFTGLIAWIVRKSFSRQDAITARFLGHMERQIVTHEETSKAQAGAITAVAEAVRDEGRITRQQIADRPCKFRESKRRT